MEKLFVIGSGGFCKQVIEITEEINKVKKEYELIGIIDDNKARLGENVLGYSVVGTTEYLKEISEKEVIYGVIAIADANIREKIVNELKLVKWANLIHPKATISKYFNLGVGNVVCGGVVINPDSSLGNHCHINIGTTFGHDVRLEDYVTIMPGCHISGNVYLKNKAIVGTGATIIQGITVETGAELGAGAVIVKNTEEKVLYVGVPAKKLRDLK
ncbi:acetyltransferase [Oceanobacillus sp. CFH 90083]|uniref:acetyltransferase n=1 Tax=Oceanobacillus sp. CFH 90083 TaxID=2592336 RepID=UPI00128D7704|nr:acetyltransferase [Oceanobacillus sp. CFH 90083]